MSRLLFFIFMSAFLYSQNISVKEIITLTNKDQGSYFHPIISPDSKVFFTSRNYTGLYYLNNQNNIQSITDEPGAGYEPAFSKDGNYVYYRPYRYQGMRKVSSLVKKSIVDQSGEILLKDQRDFTSPRLLKNGSVVVNKNKEIFFLDKKADIQNQNEAVAFIENSMIALFENGQKRILSPLGDGHYLWPSVSADGSKLLFTKAGAGTFISDLQGNILTELGKANAPKWSPDSKWIVYMYDVDDGHQLLESEIWVAAADGSLKQQITDSPDKKEIYPSWTNKVSEILFSDDRGIIYKAVLDIKN